MYNYLSKLDSERFGFSVAKIFNNVEDPHIVVQELKETATKLIIARVDFKNMKLINQLERIGFEYKDAQVTFNFDLQKELPVKTKNEFILTNYNKRHLDKIMEMTKLSFNNYGHYFADERLDRNKCLEIYMDWIQRCCEDINVADSIIVAEKDDEAIGYLALKTNNAGNEKYFAGVIGAVSPEYRKLGVFQAINIESLYLSKKLGIDRIENNVLVTNFPVMKTYTSLNYRIIRSEITMHYWFD